MDKHAFDGLSMPQWLVVVPFCWGKSHSRKERGSFAGFNSSSEPPLYVVQSEAMESGSLNSVL